MKIIKNTIIKKLLLSLILVIMLGNFVMPNYSQAVNWSKVDESAGKLAEPIFSFVNWLGDMAIGFMQKIFLGSR